MKFFFILSFILLSGGFASEEKSAVIEIEPARLVAYELEDEFDKVNDQQINRNGMYSYYLAPKTVVVEINYHKEDKAFYLFAKKKTLYWVEQIRKRFEIKEKEISVVFKEKKF